MGWRRGWVGLLVLAGVFLVSGRPISESFSLLRAPTNPSPAADPLASHDWVGASLEAANPHLSARERARIGAAVMNCADRYDLEPELVTAVMLVESDARPWAESPKGALGLMQVMPHMIQPMDLAGNPSTVESNVEAGCYILSHNIERLGYERGISAYFWGSRIRGVAYLKKVMAARQRVREQRAS
jgi:soluble lytic murein transglycosylase-like protein